MFPKRDHRIENTSLKNSSQPLDHEHGGTFWRNNLFLRGTVTEEIALT